MKNRVKGVGVAVVASAVLLGCTSLLGSFDVGSDNGVGPGSEGGSDGPTGQGDGSSGDGAAGDSAPPLTCTSPESKCVVENVCANLDTSGDHCGKCGHSCGGGTCNRGVCTPFKLYDGTLAVRTLDVGDTDLFFTTTDGNIENKLLACPLGGCKVAPRQLAVMQYTIDAIAWVNKGTVTFLSAPTQSTERPAIFACTPAGCPSPPVSFVGDGLNGVEARLRTVGNQIFYNLGGSGPGFSTCATATPGSCNAVTHIGSGSTRGTHGLAADATNVYFVDSPARGGTIATCAQNDAACVPAALVPGDASDVQGIVANGGKLFWIRPGRDGFNEGKLLTCDLPACAMPKVIANGLFTSPLSQNELYVDASGAYWFTTNSKLQRCLPGGCIGGAQDFAGPLDTPHVIVADPGFIYWAEKTAIWRLAK